MKDKGGGRGPLQDERGDGRWRRRVDGDGRSSTEKDWDEGRRAGREDGEEGKTWKDVRGIFSMEAVRRRFR